MNDLYYLIRVRDGSYWRPNGQGYTDKVSEAGKFSEWTSRGFVDEAHGDVKRVPVAPDEGSYILANNLECALVDAIKHRKEIEDSMGYTMESAYLAGMKQNLAYLRKHGTLEIRA